MAGSEVVDFSDDEAGGLVAKDLEKYAGVKGRTDRFAIIYKRTPLKDEAALSPKDKEAIKKGDKEIIERGGKKFLVAPWVIGAVCHFIKGVGAFYCLSKRKGGVITEKALCCEKEEARSYFVSPLCHYFTDKDGQIKKPFTYELKGWRFSEDKFKTLKRKNTVDEARKLVKGDILATCQEEQYQRMDLELTSKAIWRADPKLEDKVYAEAEAMAVQLEKLLGRKVTIEQLREKLGAAPADLTAEDLADPNAEDFTGLLESDDTVATT